MKVIVHLVVVGDKETMLEGEAPIFGGRDYNQKTHGSRLDKIGFWLLNWRYGGFSGPSHKNGVFIPWTSALYIIEPE